jgi:hypothetical protein
MIRLWMLAFNAVTRRCFLSVQPDEKVVAGEQVKGIEN